MMRCPNCNHLYSQDDRTVVCPIFTGISEDDILEEGEMLPKNPISTHKIRCTPQWISVDDRLPKDDNFVFVSWIYDGTRAEGEAYWDKKRGEEWVFPYWGTGKEVIVETPFVTHWMNFPDSPKDVGR